MGTPINLADVKAKKLSNGFKASRFNAKAEDKHGNLLLYNTYTKRFVSVPKSQRDAVESILQNPDGAYIDSKLFQYLLERGFIVKKSANEFRKAEMRHYETIASEGRLSLTLMPNENCNFRCKYCYESFLKNYMKESVQNGIIQFVKKNIRKFRELHVDWFGGEPLTAVPIIEKLSKEMIEICAQHRVRYSAGITTNGYLLTLDVFKKMQACRIRTFQITLDGLAHTHDQVRVRMDGSGTFEKIVSNLKSIRDNVKSGTFVMAIRSNVTKPILEDLDRYYDFFKAEFGNDPRFYCHLHATGNWGGNTVQSIESTFCTNRDIVSALQRGVEKGVNVYPLYEEHLADSVCYAAKRNNYVIGSDGMVYKCTVAFDDEYNQVGYLDEDGNLCLDEDKLALWVSGHESSDKKCQGCFFRPSCQGASCPLVRIHTDQSACPPVKTYIKDYLRIVAAQSPRIEYVQENL